MCDRITSLMDETIIYLLHTSLVKDNVSFIVDKIDPKRVKKAHKFIQEKDRLLSLGGGYLFYKYLPYGEMKLSNNGKPYLENGPYFNLSHSGEYIALAVSKSRIVGVDIEQIDENKVDAIKFSSLKEEKNVNDLETLFRIWSNKESLIKCLDAGIKDIKKVPGLPLEGVRNGCYTVSSIYKGYSLSITLKGEGPFKAQINTINTLAE